MSSAPPIRRPAVSFKRIRQQRAHEYVAEQLRRHIALRLVGPGESLPPERELAEMFGVGRPTIQQALRLLEQDRLVEARRGRHGGTFVLGPEQDAAVMDELISRLLRRRDELEQLLVYRRLLEPEVTGLAAEARSRDDLERMRLALRGMQDARTEPDYMKFDTEFHLAVAAATDNRYLLSSMEQVRLGLNDALSLLPESDTWHRRLSGEHEAIFEAIAGGDAADAAAAAELHVENSERGVRAVLAAIGRRRKGESRRKEESE